MPSAKVIKVTGPLVLDFGNGMRIHVASEGLGTAARPVKGFASRPGRKPAPATQALIAAMEADQAAGKQRDRASYAKVLMDAGHKGSPASASAILTREAKRVFGAPLGRAKASKAAKAKKSGKKGRAGRKPAPATQALITAMEADHAAGKKRTRDEYLKVLQDAGHKGSIASANQILAREAKRIFGTTLGRARKAAKKTARKTSAKRAGKKASRRRGTQGGGRQPSRETLLVRAKVQKDAESDLLKDPSQYVKWLMKQPNVKMGLKGARPLVYRELKKARDAST